MSATYEVDRAPHDSEHTYTRVANALITDRRLEDGALGLMARILQLPPGMAITVELLQRHSPSGREQIRRHLRNLEAAGYITGGPARTAEGKQKPAKTADGQWARVRRTIHEVPPQAAAAHVPPPRIPSTETTCDDAKSPVAQDPVNGVPGGKDLKTVQAETESKSGAGVPVRPLPQCPDDPDFIRFIRERMTAKFDRPVTEEQARYCRADVVAKTAVRPDTQWRRVFAVVIRNQQRPERWLPTSQPPPVSEVLTAASEAHPQSEETKDWIAWARESIATPSAERQRMDDPAPIFRLIGPPAPAGTGQDVQAENDIQAAERESRARRRRSQLVTS